ARTSLVRQLAEATQRARAHAMGREREIQATQPSAAPTSVLASRPATWASHLDDVDRAIARRDFGAAERAWRDARMSAVRAREWQPLLEVGDAALRFGAAAGDRRAYGIAARELYMAALIRARADRSMHGFLRVA